MDRDYQDAFIRNSFKNIERRIVVQNAQGSSSNIIHNKKVLSLKVKASTAATATTTTTTNTTTGTNSSSSTSSPIINTAADDAQQKSLLSSVPSSISSTWAKNFISISAVPKTNNNLSSITNDSVTLNRTNAAAAASSSKILHKNNAGSIISEQLKLLQTSKPLVAHKIINIQSSSSPTTTTTATTANSSSNAGLIINKTIKTDSKNNNSSTITTSTSTTTLNNNQSTSQMKTNSVLNNATATLSSPITLLRPNFVISKTDTKSINNASSSLSKINTESALNESNKNLSKMKIEKKIKTTNLHSKNINNNSVLASNTTTAPLTYGGIFPRVIKLPEIIPVMDKKSSSSTTPILLKKKGMKQTTTTISNNLPDDKITKKIQIYSEEDESNEIDDDENFNILSHTTIITPYSSSVKQSGEKSLSELMKKVNILNNNSSDQLLATKKFIKLKKDIDSKAASSSSAAAAASVQLKQQSLLIKNKTIEMLQKSPRAKGRSKSLSLQSRKIINKYKPRRLSVSSECKIRNSIIELRKEYEEIGEKAKMSVEKKDNLHEKLQSSTSSSMNNKEKHNLVDENLNNKLSFPPPLNIFRKKCNVVNVKDVADHNLPPPPPLISYDDINKHQQQKNINPISMKKNVKKKKMNPPPSSGEVINILKWKNGIGTTRDCRLAFHLNEFGLVEIFEKTVFRDRVDICYEKPIFERESKSQKTSDYIDPLYFCKGCNCHGAAVDFLAPNYCSHECIARYEKKKSTNHKMKTKFNLRKDYTNNTNNNDLMKKTMQCRKRKSSVSDNNHLSSSQYFPIDTTVVEIRPKRIFSWNSYLNSSKAEPASIDLFLNPFPCGPNLFEIGMKLEAIDPEHSSLFCVCTIAEKKGYRLKLHFDGYPKMYDFWINADSMDIFPPGWCSKTNRILQPPKHYVDFNWSTYLMRTKSLAAPRNLFTHLNSSSTTNRFKVGMKFEADDLRNTRKVCVASIADVLDNRILVHFDGWDESYDYWVDCCSPYIHPVNWHKLNQCEIVPPPDWNGPFEWRSYFELTINGIPTTPDLFQTRDPINFKSGMKLEIVDKKNPSLIRPGTVISTEEYELKIIFDGWPNEYAFWVVDDNPDIHPIGWCEATSHDLESPPGFEGLPAVMSCPMPGCRGIGNAAHPDLDYHSTFDTCPYESSNWVTEIEKPERLIDMSSDEKRIKISVKTEEILGNKRPHPFSNFPASATESIEMPDISKQLDQNSTKPIEKYSYNSNINIHKELFSNYGPCLEQNYNLWLSNSEAIRNYQNERTIPTNPGEWTVNQVVDYISNLPQCKSIADIFRREDIDGEAFLSLRQDDLLNMLDIKLGPSIKIFSQIVHLRAQVINQCTKQHD